MPFQRLFRLVIGVAVVAASVHPASADPVAIRSGSFTVDPTDPSHFVVFGDSFGLGFSTLDPLSYAGVKRGNLCIASLCAPGDVMDFSTQLLGTSVVTTVPHIIDGTNIVNGILYPQLALAGDLMFASAPVSVPPLGASDLSVLIEQPFTFSGHLTVSDTSSGAPVFDSDLAGAGTARLRLSRCRPQECSEPRWTSFAGATYTFADPVPEPGAMLLFVSGLLMIALRRGRSVESCFSSLKAVSRQAQR